MTTSNPFRRKPLDSQGPGGLTGAPARPELRVVEGLSEETLKELFGEDPSTVPRSTAASSQSSQSQAFPQTLPSKKRSSPATSQIRIPDDVPQTPDEHSDPFNSNPSSDSESESPPTPPRTYISAPKDTSQVRSSSINPFMRSHSPSHSPNQARRSVDLSDLRPSPTTFPNSSSSSSSGATSKATARQSLDADAFKRLMLTGQLPSLGDRADSGSTDTSSISRQSIFEPIPEAVGVREEEPTPRTSHELESEEDRRIASALGNAEPRDRSSSAPSARPKPPPPKPRSRSGGKSTLGSSTPTTTPPSPPMPKRPLEKPPLPPPPPPPPPPAAPVQPDEIFPQKKIAPSPPLSRRQSTRSQANPRASASPPIERPATPSGGAGKPPPPPPPVRRLRSVSKRPASMAGHERSGSISSSGLPPPPPPPPRKKSEDETDTNGVRVETMTEKLPLGTENDSGNVDILVDLEKLQREVDALRGQYERGGETKN